MLLFSLSERRSICRIKNKLKMRRLLTLAFILLSNLANSQNSEWYNVPYTQIRSTNQKIARSDQEGKVVWEREISEITPEDCGLYIIASSTQIKNGRIISNPSDYDYWLITESIVEDDSSYVWPTLCTEYTTLFIGGKYHRDLYLDMFGVDGKTVRLKNLHIGENKIYVANLNNGVYYLVLGMENPYDEKTFKIIINK